MSQVKQLKEELKRLQSERGTWDNMFQVLGEYVSYMKQDITSSHTPGEFLMDSVFDSKANFAASNASSSLLGMLWPGTAKKAVLIEAPDDMEMTTELTNFYSNIMTKRTWAAFDDPEAKLMMVLDEYMLDQLIFGTSAPGVFTGEKSKLLFRSYGIKNMWIDEGKNGEADTAFIMFDWPINRIAAEYGAENLSAKLKKKITDGKGHEKAKVLQVIKPRTEKKAEIGNLAMDYMSVHFEFESNKKLKEQGFEEFPLPIGRFRKLIGEKYGRCPPMNALPDIMEANVLAESIIVATEQLLNPALGVLNDGMLGGGSIDTSAGAVNVFNVQHNASNNPPVFPINTVGELVSARERLNDLHESIAQHFALDRLLDFNNDTEMTLGEVQIRDQIRSASLATLFARQMSEVFNRLVIRGVNILWRNGEFGAVEDMPQEVQDRIANDQDVFKVTFTTKAAAAQDAEDYLAIIELLGQYRQDVQLDPSIRHRVDVGMAYKIMGDIRGVRAGIIRDDDAAEALAEQARQQEQEAGALEAANSMADTGEKMANIQMAVNNEQAN